MALLALFDGQNQPLGLLKDKKAVHLDGDWHRTAEIVVVNNRQEVLLSLRHPDKPYLPNYWDVCLGGHLDPDETYEEAAIRELEEEIGVQVPDHELVSLGTVEVVAIDEKNRLHDREHAGVFVWQTTLSLEQFTMQPDEVAALQWRPIREVIRDLAVAEPSLRYTPPSKAYRQMILWGLDWLSRLDKD